MTSSSLTRLPTFSHTPRAFACPPSFALPEDAPHSSTSSSRGIAIHAYLADVPRIGVEAALAKVPSEWRNDCARIDLDGLPLSGDNIQELALAYDMVSGEVVELGRDIGRNYGEVSLTRLPGTLDVAYREGSMACYDDYKTGHSVLPPPKKHMQFRVGCMALAKWMGCGSARARMIHINDDGSHWTEEYVFDAEELAEIEAEFARGIVAVLAAQDAFARGEKLSVQPGDHCTYCPCWTSCPSKTSLMRQVVKERDTLETRLSNLFTEELFPQALAAITEIGQWYSRIKGQAKAFGKRYTVALGDGWYYGENTVQVKEYDGQRVFDVVEKELGTSAAKVAVGMDASRASIQRAVEWARDHHPDEEVRKRASVVAPMVRDLVDKVSKAGGLTTKPQVRVEEHKKIKAA